MELAAAVPTVPNWTMTTIPKSLPLEQIDRLLIACRRDTAAGRRDFAIILLMVRLGLRAGEVVRLTLDDIDWHLGCLTIHGKAGHMGQLPLPTDVGEAIVDYLRNGRQRTSCRRLFLSTQAPVQGFSTHGAISGVVRKALQGAGIDSPRKGAHQLRHALATGMLQRGASLGEIGEVLRHRSLQSTTEALNNYLAMRRGLGFKLKVHGSELAGFVSFLEQQKSEYITTKLALEWSQQPTPVQPDRWNGRLGFVRSFALVGKFERGIA